MKVATPSLPAYPQMGLGGEAKLPAAKCGKQPNPYLSCGGVGREGGGRWLLLQVGSQPLPPHLYNIVIDVGFMPIISLLFSVCSLYFQVSVFCILPSSELFEYFLVFYFT